MGDSNDILSRLMAVIEGRRANPSPESYTSRLLEAGIPKIGEKVREEAGEVVEAASEPGDEGRSHTIYEAADLVYHLLVLLCSRGVSLEELEKELARRFGTSGLAEKASRASVEIESKPASDFP